MFHDFATTPGVEQMLVAAHPTGRIGRPSEIASAGARRDGPRRKTTWRRVDTLTGADLATYRLRSAFTASTQAGRRECR
jgi:hypothetical protein